MTRTSILACSVFLILLASLRACAATSDPCAVLASLRDHTEGNELISDLSFPLGSVNESWQLMVNDKGVYRLSPKRFAPTPTSPVHVSLTLQLRPGNNRVEVRHVYDRESEICAKFVYYESHPLVSRFAVLAQGEMPPGSEMENSSENLKVSLINGGISQNRISIATSRKDSLRELYEAVHAASDQDQILFYYVGHTTQTASQSLPVLRFSDSNDASLTLLDVIQALTSGSVKQVSLIVDGYDRDGPRGVNGKRNDSPMDSLRSTSVSSSLTFLSDPRVSLELAIRNGLDAGTPYHEHSISNIAGRVISAIESAPADADCLSLRSILDPGALSTNAIHDSYLNTGALSSSFCFRERKSQSDDISIEALPQERKTSSVLRDGVKFSFPATVKADTVPLFGRRNTDFSGSALLPRRGARGKRVPRRANRRRGRELLPCRRISSAWSRRSSCWRQPILPRCDTG